MAFNPKDHYYYKAKEQNFAARSVFKLEEIDSKYKLLKPGQKILDFGASPGSWSQYCAKKIGPSGKVLGIDLSPIQIKLPNAVFVQADLRDLNLETTFAEHGLQAPFDLVVSDMAPKTTGIRLTDQARSVELVELAIDVAEKFLKPGGSFVAKLFHCDDFTQLKERIRKDYARFEAMKPDSTRKMSKEIFLIGLKKK